MDITKWEYRKVSTQTHESELDELGKQGWEAFATDSAKIILKRPCGRIHVNEIANRVEIQQTPDFNLDNIK